MQFRDNAHVVSEVKVWVYSWRFLVVLAIYTCNSQVYGILEDIFVSFEPRRLNAKTSGTFVSAIHVPASLFQDELFKYEDETFVTFTPQW